MPRLVVDGATLRCDQGSAPSRLTVLPTNETRGDERPAATVRDFVPMTNVAPFGMCRSPANPQVASATAAAQGVLTPQPCTPVIGGPWSPGAAGVTLNGAAALTDDSRCACAWQGVVTVARPGPSGVTTS